MANERPEWQQLELLIAEIQKDLAPNATVTHNSTLWGHDSETNRQIDVLVEQQIGQFQMRIIFDCKDYKVPVDVKGIDGFISMVRDVRAHQGCLVSAKGFTASAKKAAKKCVHCSNPTGRYARIPPPIMQQGRHVRYWEQLCR